MNCNVYATIYSAFDAHDVDDCDAALVDVICYFVCQCCRYLLDQTENSYADLWDQL